MPVTNAGRFSDALMRRVHHATLAGEKIRDLARAYRLGYCALSDHLTQWRTAHGITTAQVGSRARAASGRYERLRAKANPSIIPT